jgi:hypothetical protein
VTTHELTKTFHRGPQLPETSLHCFFDLVLACLNTTHTICLFGVLGHFCILNLVSTMESSSASSSSSSSFGVVVVGGSKQERSALRHCSFHHGLRLEAS